MAKAKAGKGAVEAKEERTFDPAAMDAAAKQAAKAFDKLKPEVKTAIMKFYTHPDHGFKKAGHKRLGRLFVAKAKEADIIETKAAKAA